MTRSARSRRIANARRTVELCCRREQWMTSKLRQVATGLLFDRNAHLLIYLRDAKPTIPFPNRWDLFGGHVEEGETPEIAFVREVREELGLSLESYSFFRSYYCMVGDATP